MVTVWDAIEEMITPPFIIRLAGGPSNNDHFKTFKVNFGGNILECDLPYGFSGCDGPSDQYNAYKWAKSAGTEYDRIINLNTLDEEYKGYGHWDDNVYRFKTFTWHYQTKLLFRKFFDTASISIGFLIHKTKQELNSFTDIESFIRQHYDEYAKEYEYDYVPVKYEIIEHGGIQWLKYSGNMMPHLTNQIEDNYVVPLDNNHFLMITIRNTIEGRSGLLRQEINEQIPKDVAALISGVRFKPAALEQKEALK